MTNHTGTIYIIRKTKMSRPIRQSAVYDENDARQ